MGGGGVPPGGGMVPPAGMVPVPVPAPAPVPVAVNSGPVTLNQEQLTKLNSELDVVQQNCKVFNEMLTEMTPGQEDPSDLELLQVSVIQFTTTCEFFSKKIKRRFKSI